MKHYAQPELKNATLNFNLFKVCHLQIRHKPKYQLLISSIQSCKSLGLGLRPACNLSVTRDPGHLTERLGFTLNVCKCLNLLNLLEC